jgi:hypothetical protein
MTSLLSWLVLFLSGASVHAALTEGQVRAGFVFNIAKFVEWPSSAFSAEASPLIMCTHALLPETESAVSLLEGKLVGNRVIQLLKNPSSIKGCHIFYMGKISRFFMREKMKSDESVLMISDEPGFIRSGGAIELFLIGNRLAFSVNLAASRRTGIRLGAPLLQLAHEVVHP